MKKNGMSKEAMEARREYFRKYRKNNPEKVAAANARHWAKVAERMKYEREREDANE